MLIPKIDNHFLYRKKKSTASFELKKRRHSYLGTTALAFFSIMSALPPRTADAANVTWGGAGSSTTTTDYNSSTNWGPTTAPTTAGQAAIFANTGSTFVVVSAGPIAPDSWTFNVNSQSYAITGQAVNFTTGITNNANNSQVTSIANNMTGTTLSQAGGSLLTLLGTDNFSTTNVTSGHLQILGTLTSTVTNSAILTNAGAITGTVTNSGTFFNNNVVSGLLTNSAGTTTNTGNLNGGAYVGGGGTLNTDAATSNVQGGLTNLGTVNARGQVNGTILNQGGVFSVFNGALSGNDTFTNNGASILAVSGGNFTGITTLTNSSTDLHGIAVAAGRTLSAANISNNAGAFIQNSGTIDATSSPLANAGTLNNLLAGSIIKGGLSNTGGVTTNLGTINGNVGVSGGTLTGNGSIVGATTILGGARLRPAAELRAAR